MSSNTHRRSTEAYDKVVRSGLISKRAAEVYDYIYRYGAMGKREMFERYKAGNPSASVQVDSFGPRFAQLVKAGLLEEVGEKKCIWSHQTVTIWDVTSKIPTERLGKGPKNPDAKSALKERIKILEREKADLQRRLEEAEGRSFATSQQGSLF